MSDDLISRQNLVTTLNIKEECHDCAYGTLAFCTRSSDFANACEAITDAPSIDAVEVVRCKDCKHYDSHDHRCKVWNHGIGMEDFCSHGERKES